MLCASNAHPQPRERKRTQGVHGISTRKVYPPHRLPGMVVRSYRTFSPLPASPRRKWVAPNPPLWKRAVIFCDPFYAAELLRQLHPLGGAVRCVVRTFLPFSDFHRKKGGRAVCSSIFIAVFTGQFRFVTILCASSALILCLKMWSEFSGHSVLA